MALSTIPEAVTVIPNTYLRIMADSRCRSIIYGRAGSTSRDLPEVQSLMTGYAKAHFGENIHPSDILVYPFRSQRSGEEVGPVFAVALKCSYKEHIIVTDLTGIPDVDIDLIKFRTRNDPFSIERSEIRNGENAYIEY